MTDVCQCGDCAPVTTATRRLMDAAGRVLDSLVSSPLPEDDRLTVFRRPVRERLVVIRGGLA